MVSCRVASTVISDILYSFSRVYSFRFILRPLSLTSLVSPHTALVGVPSVPHASSSAITHMSQPMELTDSQIRYVMLPPDPTPAPPRSGSAPCSFPRSPGPPARGRALPLINPSRTPSESCTVCCSCVCGLWCASEWAGAWDPARYRVLVVRAIRHSTRHSFRSLYPHPPPPTRPTPTPQAPRSSFFSNHLCEPCTSL
jgi:hypothetical protein